MQYNLSEKWLLILTATIIFFYQGSAHSLSSYFIDLFLTWEDNWEAQLSI